MHFSKAKEDILAAKNSLQFTLNKIGINLFSCLKVDAGILHF